MVYSGNELLYILHPEGTVSHSDGQFTYDYFKSDHTGSTRALLSAADGSLQTQQTTDYYPFGMAWSLNNLNKNKYLYSGKEIEDATLEGNVLALYDFGARFYNPVLGRWFNMDPQLQLANPYIYCGNNPVLYVDPDGQFFFASLRIGGFMNCFMNAENIHNFWQGLGHFLVGAGVGAATSAAGQWASNATLAVGIIPGATIGGLTGAATGAAGGFLMNGLNNLIQGQGFTDNAGRSVGSGALNGFMNGFISGGIEGYNRAEALSQNKWTGGINKKLYSIYVDGYLQPDPSRHCYGYAMAEMDRYHTGIGPNVFLEKANYADGCDPEDVAVAVYGRNRVKGIGKKIYNSQYNYMKSVGIINPNNIGMVGTLGPANEAHAVTIYEIREMSRMKVFGGGQKQFMGVRYRDPINGMQSLSKLQSFSKIVYVFY